MHLVSRINAVHSRVVDWIHGPEQASSRSLFFLFEFKTQGVIRKSEHQCNSAQLNQGRCFAIVCCGLHDWPARQRRLHNMSMVLTGLRLSLSRWIFVGCGAWKHPWHACYSQATLLGRSTPGRLLLHPRVRHHPPIGNPAKQSRSTGTRAVRSRGISRRFTAVTAKPPWSA